MADPAPLSYKTRGGGGGGAGGCRIQGPGPAAPPCPHRSKCEACTPESVINRKGGGGGGLAQGQGDGRLGGGGTPGCVAVCSRLAPISLSPLTPCPSLEPSPSAGGGLHRPLTPSCPSLPLCLAYPHLPHTPFRSLGRWCQGNGGGGGWGAASGGRRLRDASSAPRVRGPRAAAPSPPPPPQA